jgi:Chaperone of endosialidase
MNLFRLKDCNYTNQKFNGSALLPVALVLACFAISPTAQAVVPAPDGGYPGGNTAEGQNALLSLASGVHNTAIGYLSLRNTTTGGYNTALGSGTLLANTADGNTAIGVFALIGNTIGGLNTANGALALFSNTEGNSNTANGFGALQSNTTGFSNTANGVTALNHNTAGSDNTANGTNALYNNTTGSYNTALGQAAGVNLTTGDNNVYIGSFIGGVAGESNHTYIKNINTTSVSGGGTDTVTVNLTTGLLGHATSSRRYKEDIKPMDKASEALYRLNPVTYRYKKEIDATQRPAFGLIAEEVAEVNPDLVAHNVKEQPESVHYEMVNAMLLNEFLKEHRKVEKLRKDFQATVAQQQKEIQALTAQLKEQAAQIQKVSAQVEVSKFATGRIRRGGPAPRTVVSND